MDTPEPDLTTKQVGGEEGWYTDPFARHEARWMSNGKPTKLVRDGGVDSYDDPPDEKPTVKPLPIEGTEAQDGNDLLRADEPEHKSFDPEASSRAVMDVFDQTNMT